MCYSQLAQTTLHIGRWEQPQNCTTSLFSSQELIGNHFEINSSWSFILYTYIFSISRFCSNMRDWEVFVCCANAWIIWWRSDCKEEDTNEIDLDDLPYGTWMKASPMRANKVTGMRNEVKIGSFGSRSLENTRSTQIQLKGKGQTWEYWKKEK